MEIDHIFCFVAGAAAAEAAARTLGLSPTYARRHPGQGTANVCCCFDNAYLEFLYLTDADEAMSSLVRRLGLVERAGWQSNDASPFGFAWRGTVAKANVPPMWIYRPAYLPPDKGISIATASDDVRLPLIFSFPGTSPPVTWPPEQRGRLQHDSGYSSIRAIDLHVGAGLVAETALTWLAGAAGTEFSIKAGASPELHLTLNDLHGAPTARISLPSLAVARLDN